MNDQQLNDIYSVAEALLENELSLEIRMTGFSMFPALKGGEFAIVEKCDAGKLKPGDIIVFRKQQKLIAHRLLKISSVKGIRLFIARGDNNLFYDQPVSADEIIGKVVSKRTRTGKPTGFKNKGLRRIMQLKFPKASSVFNNYHLKVTMLPATLNRHLQKLKAAYKLVAGDSKSLIAGNAVLSVLQGALPFVLIICIKLLVDYLTGATTGFFGTDTVFYGLLVCTALLFFASGLVNELRSFWGEKMSQSVVKRMYATVQQKHQQLQIATLENPKELDKIHRAVQESTYRPVKFINDGLQLLRSVASALFLLALFVSIKWYLALVLFVSVLPGLLIRIRFARRQHRLKKEQSTTEREMYYFNRVLTAFPFAKELKLFHFKQFFEDNFEKRQDRLFRERIGLRRSEILQNIGSHLFTVVLIFVALAWISYLKMQGDVSLGAVVLFLFAFQRGFTVLNDLFRSFTQLFEDSSYLEEIIQFVELPVAAPESTVKMTINEAIRIENLGFSYANSKRQALKNINMTIQAGKTIAVVGHNGSGKSTFIKLLCGFYLPDEGLISYDGVSTVQLGQKAISENMAAVFQDFALYNVSAAQNIALGRISAVADDEQVINAAKAAGIHEVLAKLPNGYNTLLGNSFYGGEELSMGQWQKLAIARAFFRNADFIVMDEPSSALDVYSEQQIMKSVNEMTRNKTAVIISHRLSSVQWVDEIYVFNQGEITEHGTHEELMALKGYYYDLFLTSRKDISD